MRPRSLRIEAGERQSEGGTVGDDGLITIASNYSVAETIDRLADAATSAGLRVFARVDHGAGAKEVAMALRPTQLLIFGHPRGGTPLMQARQTVGIDLPLKGLAWEDDAGQVWLTYNDAGWLARRHELGPATDASTEAIGSALGRLASAAGGS
jgi:uncharacterized protein (DUF302 family)